MKATQFGPALRAKAAKRGFRRARQSFSKSPVL